MPEPRTERERVYDDQISPHMAEILRICKEHQINMFATFSLGNDPEVDENLYCTSLLGTHDDDPEGVKKMMDLSRENRRTPRVMAVTVTKAET